MKRCKGHMKEKKRLQEKHKHTQCLMSRAVACEAETGSAFGPVLDFTKVKLVIDRIKHSPENPDIKRYVMAPSPNLHFDDLHLSDEDGNTCFAVLIDEKGKKHFATGMSYGFLSDPNDPDIMEYTFEFGKENKHDFHIGEALTKQPPAWKQHIPDSVLESIEYEVHASAAWTFETLEKMNLTVNTDGEVSVIRGRTVYLSQEKTAMFTLPKETARKVLDGMLACVSRSNSYRDSPPCDTGWHTAFHFANGCSLEYDGIYAYNDKEGYHSNVQIIETLLKQNLNSSFFENDPE